MLIALTAWKQRAPVTPGLEDVAWKSIELHNALPPGELVSRITDEAVIRSFVMKLVEQKPIIVPEAPQGSPQPGPVPDYIVEMEAPPGAQSQSLAIWLSNGMHRIEWWSHSEQHFRIDFPEQLQNQIFKLLNVRWGNQGLVPISAQPHETEKIVR